MYRHGQIDDLNDKLLYFVDNRSALESYEVDSHCLVGIRQHVNTLMAECYRGQGTESGSSGKFGPLISEPRQENEC